VGLSVLTTEAPPAGQVRGRDELWRFLAFIDCIDEPVSFFD